MNYLTARDSKAERKGISIVEISTFNVSSSRINFLYIHITPGSTSFFILPSIYQPKFIKMVSIKSLLSIVKFLAITVSAATEINYLVNCAGCPTGNGCE